MSHMSLLETHARYSVAISILNKLRHWLIRRDGAVLGEEDKSILLESLEMSESQNLSDKMVLYSFHGFGSHHVAAAIELSEAITNVLEQVDQEKRGAYLEALKEAIESDDIEALDPDETTLAIEFVTQAMYVIDSKEETGTSSILTPKDL
jgi:hypothetical protein